MDKKTWYFDLCSDDILYTRSKVRLRRFKFSTNWTSFETKLPFNRRPTARLLIWDDLDEDLDLVFYFDFE